MGDLHAIDPEGTSACGLTGLHEAFDPAIEWTADVKASRCEDCVRSVPPS